MKRSFLLGMAVLVAMAMPPKSFADDGGKSAKMGEVSLLSQSGSAVVEVQKADRNTMHFLEGDGLSWGLDGDMGWTGVDTVQLAGLKPGTPYLFRVMRRTVGTGGVSEAVASDTVTDTTWCQTRWGSDSLRTQRFDPVLAAGEQLLVGPVVRPDSVARFLSLVLFCSSDSAMVEVVIADSTTSWSPWGTVGGRVFWQDTITVSGKGPVEVPIDPHVFDPFPGLPEPSRFWLTVQNVGPLLVVFYTASDGLPFWLKTRGWQHHDSTGAMLAFGVEPKKNTAVSSRPTAQPDGFGLSQNYPNPFNPSTSFSYSLPVSNNVTIDIYNELGTKVRSLVNRFATAGTYTATWDGQDDNGNSLSSGIYFCKMQASHFSSVKKILLVR